MGFYKEKGKVFNKCTCCGHVSQVYRRKLRNDMVKCLYIIHNEGSQRVKDLKGKVTTGAEADFHKLKHWGLINADHTKGNGFYRLTENGKLFIQGKHKVPTYVWVHNGKSVSRPYLDDIINKMVSVKEVGYEPVSLESAVQNSFPFQG